MRLTAVGDTMISHPLRAPDNPVFARARAGDVTIGNCEVPLTVVGRPADKTVPLHAPPAMAAEYSAIGLDAWTLANNHMMDYGEEGLRSTLAVMGQAGQTVVGAGEDLASARQPVVLNAAGVRPVTLINASATLPIGAAATATLPGIAPLRVTQTYEWEAARLAEQPGSPPKVHTTPDEQDLTELLLLVSSAATTTTVVVALHWGVPEVFLPPNQGPLAEYQRETAHRLIGAGATVILGTHPHSVHPLEFYEGGVVLYSLGNFLFHEELVPAPGDRRRVAPLKPVLHRGQWFESAIFDVEIDDAGPCSTARTVRVVPIHLDEDGEPHLVEGGGGKPTIDRILRFSQELDPDIRYEDGVFRPASSPRQTAPSTERHPS